MDITAGGEWLAGSEVASAIDGKVNDGKAKRDRGEGPSCLPALP